MSRSVRLPDRRALLACAACASLFASRTALAEAPGPVDLRWDAPARCPSQRWVIDRVRALAGSTSDAHGPIRADAHVEGPRAGKGYRLTLVVHYGQTTGTRVITSSSCEDLAGAAAVAISLLLGESAAGTPAPATAAPGPSTGGGAGAASTAGTAPAANTGAAANPGAAVNANTNEYTRSPPAASTANAADHVEPAAAPKPGHTDRTPSASPPRRWHIDVRAPALLVDAGSLPHAGFGFGGGASLQYDAFRVALGGAVWLSQSVTSADGPSPAGADFDRWSLDVAGCRAWRAGFVEVAPCVSLSFDDVSARGNGPQVSPLSAQTSWVSLGPEVLGSLRLTDYAALVLGVSARWATSQPRFVVGGLGELYQVAPITAEALLGCDWIL